MPSVAELQVVIGADLKGLDAGLAAADKKVGGFGESMKSGLGMGLGFGAVGAAIGLVGDAFSLAKGSIIDLNGSLEQSKIAFTTMLGSGEKAEAFLGDLQKFAANTPFEFPDLVDASKRMLAFGFESKNVVPLLTAVGDAVAAVGGGKETIDGVTTALGQMQAKGKVSAEEMGQLAERGIPAWDMLAKKLGVSVSEAMDMVSKGQVKAATFVEAFQEGSAERFGGMMEKQSATWSGALSTIKDSLSMATATAFQPFFKMISEGAIMLSKFVQSDTFTAWAGALSTAIDGVVRVVRGLINIFLGSDDFDQIADLLDNIFPPAVSDALMFAVSDLGALFESIFAGDIPGAIEAGLFVLEDFGGILTGLVEDWAKSIAGWVDSARPDLLSNLGDMAVGIQDWVLTTGLDIIEKLGTWAAAFVDWVGPKIPDLLRELGAFAAKMLAWAGGTALPLLVEKLFEWGTAFIEWIAPKIGPMLVEAGKLLVELGTWLIGTALPAIVGKLVEWGDAFTAWVVPKIPGLLLELGKLLLALNDWAISVALPGIVGKLVEWGGAFLGWVAKDVIPTLPEKLGAILTAISGWVGQKVGEVTASVKSIGSGILQGIQDGISGALGGFWSWLQSNFVDKIPSFVRDLLNIHSPSGVFADIGRNIVDGLRVGMEQKLPSVDDVISRVVGRVSGMSGAVDDWLRLAMKYTGAPDSWLEPLKWIVGHESGGDPHAKNPDSTAAGLFQMIDTTWAGARDKSLPNDIFNPVVNAIAGIRYIKGRYGDPFSAVDFWKKNNHYAEGGWAGLHGPELAVLGERGPEYVVPNHALGGGGGVSGPMQTHRIVLEDPDGRKLADFYIRGRDFAIRQGRDTF